METETKRQLIEELDKSLLAHAAALGEKEGGPSIGDIYGLQDLAERHYYLKAEHEFTAAEAEALLAFADPLAVACACWEENEHEHSFPICELLEEIDACQRFPLKSQAPGLVDEVKAAMKREFAEYQAVVLRMGKEDILSKSAEITAMRQALDFMLGDYKFEPGDAAALLRMEKPLRFVAGLWPADIPFLLDMEGRLSEELGTVKAYQQEYETAAQESTPADRPSLRGRLCAATREAHQRRLQAGRLRRETEPKNL